MVCCGGDDPCGKHSTVDPMQADALADETARMGAPAVPGHPPDRRAILGERGPQPTEGEDIAHGDAMALPPVVEDEEPGAGALHPAVHAPRCQVHVHRARGLPQPIGQPATRPFGIVQVTGIEQDLGRGLAVARGRSLGEEGIRPGSGIVDGGHPLTL